MDGQMKLFRTKQMSPSLAISVILAFSKYPNNSHCFGSVYIHNFTGLRHSLCISQPVTATIFNNTPALNRTFFIYKMNHGMSEGYEVCWNFWKAFSDVNQTLFNEETVSYMALLNISVE
jgi:hypothetical protein